MNRLLPYFTNFFLILFFYFVRQINFDSYTTMREVFACNRKINPFKTSRNINSGRWIDWNGDDMCLTKRSKWETMQWDEFIFVRFGLIIFFMSVFIVCNNNSAMKWNLISKSIIVIKLFSSFFSSSSRSQLVDDIQQLQSTTN